MIKRYLYRKDKAQAQAQAQVRAVRGMGNRSGFTLPEVMIGAMVFVFCLLGLMQSFLYFSQAGTIAQAKIRALTEAQNKIEEIRNTEFDNIYSTYGNGAWQTFNLTLVNGQGFVRINNTNAELLQVEVAISWESVPGRMIGGETGGVVTSPMMMRTLIAQK